MPARILIIAYKMLVLYKRIGRGKTNDADRKGDN